MTDRFEPVAQEPAAPATAAAPAARRNVWQVVGVTAIAAAAGLGGFVVGSHNDTIRPASHMEQWGGPMPGGAVPGGPMGGNGKPGGPMGDGRSMRMGPHCEDSSGNHAAVLPDGSCPSGYTLDDKGGKAGMPGNPMGPTVSPSATPQG